MDFKDSEQAFNEAIMQGRLTTDILSPLYAGKWMYMGTDNGHDLFKNINTRQYLEASRAQ